MKMKKALKRTLAFVLAAMLTAGTAVIPASAEEIQDDIYQDDGFQEDNVQNDMGQDNIQDDNAGVEWQEPETKVSGVRVTLKPSDYIRDMDWGYFSEAPDSGNWIGRMELPDFAVNLYNTLAAGSDNDGVDDILIEDSVFTEEQALTVNYSNGKQDVFNAVEILNVTYDAKMEDEEWEAIQENICQAFNAFRLDYPGVFWLKDSLKVTRVLTEQTDETGATYYSYQVYLLLKNYGRKYDIRSKKYQSAEAIRAVMAERDASLQEVLAGLASDNTADTITYFKDNLKVVAKSMGSSSDNAARALKMLCDNAGIPCILASGAGGVLEDYVAVDGAWLATDEIEEMLAEQKKAAEEQAKAAEDAAKKEQEQKEEEQKPVAAQPAMRQARTMTAVQAAANPTSYVSARTVGQFYIGNTPVSGDAVLAAVAKPNEARTEFGYTWGEIFSIDENNNAKVSYEATADNPVSITRFELRDSGDYPLAGNRQYEIRGYYGSGNDEKYVTLSDTDFPIRKRELEVDSTDFAFVRTYRTKTFDLDKNAKPTYSGEVTAALVDDKDKVVKTTLTADTANLLNEPMENSQGTIDGILKLSADSARNYVFKETGTDTITLHDITYSCQAQVLKSTNLIKIALEPEYFTYTDDNVSKIPSVTVSIDGEIMSPNYDYTVTTGTNVTEATTTGDDTTFVRILPTSSSWKYKWDPKQLDVKKAYVIRPADWNKSETEVSDTVRYGRTKELDLSAYMPTDAIIKSVAILDEGKSPIQEARVAASQGAILEYVIPDEPTLKDSKGRMSVLIGNSRNYNDYYVYITVNVIDKLEQEEFRFENEAIKIARKGKDSVKVSAVEGSTVTYESNHPEIVTVDKQSGEIVGLAEGVAVITAKATAIGEYKAKTIECKVTVVPRSTEIIKDAPIVTQGEYQYKLEIERGISQQPSNLSNTSIEEIEKSLKDTIKDLDSAIVDEHIEVYDVTLLRRLVDLEDAAGNRKFDWEVVDKEEEFPEGLTVTFPYRGVLEERKDKLNKTSFAVAHMFTEEINDNKPGDIESWSDDKIDKTNEGLQFMITGLSPIAIGWGPIRNDQDSFKFEYETMKIPLSGTTALAVKSPVDGDITYTTSNPNVVTVRDDGTIRAVDIGRATITATAPENDDYRGKTITCDIIVIPRTSTASFTPEFTEGGYRYKLEVEKGISQCPANLSDVGIAEIERRLKEQILALDPTIQEANIGTYDITLYRRPADANSEEISKIVNWEVVDTEEEFPVGGLEITVPYPEGRGADKAAKTSYAAVHMFAETINGNMPGEIESRSNDAIEKTADGLKFMVNGLSPIAVGWGPIRDEQAGFKLEYDVRKITESEEFSLGLQTAEGSTVTYETDDPDIVDVDEEGNVYGISEGRTTIRAIASGTEDYLPKTVTCDFIVIPEDSVVDFTDEFTKGGNTYKLEIEKGLSMYPTDSLAKDSSEIDEDLRKEILKLKSTIPEENIEVYDVALYKKAEDSYNWELVNDKNFPKAGVAITIPYPEGRDGTNSAYAMAHMFTTRANGKKPGGIEKWTDKQIKKTDNGLQVTVKGLSPVAVGWEEVIPQDDPNNPDNPTNPTDPNNPTDPTNPTDPANPNNNNTDTNTGTNGTNGTNTGTTGRTATTGSSGATSGTTTGTGTKSAATGDTNQIVLYIVLFAAAAAVFGMVFAVRKKRK